MPVPTVAESSTRPSLATQVPAVDAGQSWRASASAAFGAAVERALAGVEAPVHVGAERAVEAGHLGREGVKVADRGSTAPSSTIRPTFSGNSSAYIVPR